jgi:FKBP-type peptidyl-prolyl cis-trans isomerase SlyD
MAKDNRVNKDKVVSIDYKVQMEDGQVIDASEEGKPLQYLHGHGQIISGLEKALEGAGVGDSLEVTVKPAEAYGPRNEEAMEWLPRDAFPNEDQLEPGMVFEVQEETGETAALVVRDLEEDRVLVDYNHPLAGETLRFDVEVLNVRSATEEEKQHGHAH